MEYFKLKKVLGLVIIINLYLIFTSSVVFASGVISGKVTLQSRTKYQSLITFTLVKTGESTPFKTYNVNIAVNGSYSLPDVAPGIYNLSAKLANFLSQNQVLIDLTDGQNVSGINFSLLAGDCDNDNVVSNVDLAILNAAYGSKIGGAKWDARADFNGNGQIDGTDFSALKANNGKSGVEPQISITSPQDNSFISDFSITVSGSVGDNNTVVTVNGVTAAMANKTFTAAGIQLAQGQERISAIATNKYGIKNADLVIVKYDGTAPQITNVSPSQGVYLKDTKPVLSAVFSDDFSGINLSSAKVILDGVDITAGITISQTGFSYTPQEDLSQGGHNLTIDVKDNAGNAAAHVARDWTIDTVIPLVTITSPIDHSATNSNSIIVYGTISEPAEVTVNGVSAVVNNGEFTADNVPLSGSPAAIQAKAIDSAGNTGSAEISVIRDFVPPKIEITSPQEGAKVNTNKIQVSGTIDDNNASVTVNNITAVTANGRFSAVDVPLSEGQNFITAKAIDPSDNQAQAVIQVSCDSIAPVVKINSPFNNSTVRTQEIDVCGTIDDTAAAVTLNGKAVVVDSAGKSFSSSGISLSEGENVIVVTALDSAANSGSDSIKVILDTTAPQLNVSEPAEGLLTNSASLTVRGNVNEASARISVKVGSAASVSAVLDSRDLTFSAVVNLAEGANSVAVQAVDLVNNSVTVKRNVVLDTGVPLVAITSPQNNFVSRQKSLRVEGTVTDAHNVTVTVNGQSAAVANGKFVFDGLQLVEGDNVITAAAKDAAGNQASAVLNVILDTTAPSSPVLDSLPQFINTDRVTIKGSAEPGSNVLVSGGAASVTAVADQSGAFSAQVFLSPNTTNNLQVTAQDKTGNISQPSNISIIHDNILPLINLSAPGNNSILPVPAVLVRGRVTDVNTIASLTVNGNAVLPAADGSFEYSLNAPGQGAYAINVEAIDAANNKANSIVNVTINQQVEDTTAPVICITNPLNESYVNQPNLAVIGTITDASPIVETKVFVDEVDSGAAVTIDQGVFSAQVNLSGEAVHIIKVTAKDNKNNQGTSTARVTLDTTAPVKPVVSVVSPASPAKTLSVNLMGIAESGVRIKVKANGIYSLAQAEAAGNGSFSITVNLTKDIENSIEVFAVDKAGNISPAAELKVVQDSIVPQVVSVEPLDNAVGVAVNSKIKVVFSETIKAASLSCNLVLKNSNSQVIAAATAFQADSGDKILLITPNSALPDSQVITLRLAKDISDLAGNILGQDSFSRFTTIDLTGPSAPVLDTYKGITKETKLVISGAAENGAKVDAEKNGTAVVTGYAGSNGKFSLELPLEPNSENVFVLVAFDVSNNRGSAVQVKIIQDSIAPQVSISPDNGAVGVVYNSKVVFTFNEAMDPALINQQNSGSSNLRVMNAAVAAQGNFSLSADKRIAAWTPAVNFPDSAQITAIVTTAVKDLAGNALTVQAQSVFSIRDAIAPAAPVINEITPSSPTNQNSVIIKGSAEAKSKVGRFLQGAVSDWVDADPSSGAFQINVSLEPNQINQIELAAKDASGNQSLPVKINLTNDTLPPQVTNVVPADTTVGVVVGTAIAISFSEPVKSSTALDKITLADELGLTVPGNLVFSAGNSTVTFKPGVNLSAGTKFTLTIAEGLSDEAGNQMGLVFKSVFTTGGSSSNRPPPKPLITSVIPESPTKETRVVLKGSAYPGTTVNVTGGAKLESTTSDTEGNFTVNVDLNINRENLLLVTAVNKYGSSPADNISVVQDSSGPEIEIMSPLNSAVVHAADIPVCGVVSDKSGIKEVKVNNTVVEVRGDYFESSASLVEGDNTITVSATDNLGNSSSQNVSVQYVKGQPCEYPPVVTITFPRSNATVAPVVNVKGTVVDSSPIKDFNINGVYCPVQNNRFDALIKLNGGTQNITAQATNNAGLISSASIQVLVDDIPPARPILYALPQMTTLSVVTVKGRTDVKARVEVENNAAIIRAAADFNGDFNVVVSLLADRVNTLQVTAYDQVGNRSEPATIEILQDSTPLVVTNITPAAAARMVEPDSLIYVEFSKPVNEGSIKAAGNFKVIAVLDGSRTQLAGNITLTPEKTIAVFAPQENFPAGAEILITLSPNIVSSQDAGLHLSGEFSSSFTIIPPVTMVSGVVLASDMRPLAGATISIANSYLKTTVTSGGGFLIKRVPEGTQDIIIDGSTSSLPEKFGKLSIRLTVIAGKENKLSRPVFMTAINEKSLVMISPNADQVIDFNNQIPGLSLSIKAGSLVFAGGKFNGLISAALIEPNSYPGRLPDTSLPEFLVMFEPKGVVINPAAELTLPNVSGLEPGKEVIVFHFQDGLYQYEELGKYAVSNDGKSIVCPGCIKGFSYLGYKLQYPGAGVRYLEGKVVDKAGAGIPGVSVTALGAETETITQDNGSYTIALPPGTLKDIKVFATVGVSLSGGQSQKVVYASTPLNPLETGASKVPDIVVDSFTLSAGLRLVDKQEKMIDWGSQTTFDDKGNLKTIASDDLKDIQLMVFRQNSAGEFSKLPVVVFSPTPLAVDSREHLRFSERIFNGPLGIETPGEKSAVRIEEGEILRVAAYSSKLGYVGLREVSAPKAGESTMVVCDIVMSPPEILMKVERLFYANQQRQSRIIPHGGTSLITDQAIMILTSWKAGGKLLPDMDGIKLFGRLMTAADKGFSKKQEKDLRFTIPAGESARVLEIRGTFPDSHAAIDVVNFPGDEYMEISPERAFVSENILPLSIAGVTGEYLSQNIRRYNFHISSDTEAQAISVFGVSVSSPDDDGMITVTGKAGSVEAESEVVVSNLSNGESVTVIANADGSFIVRIKGSVGDIIQVTAKDKSGNLTNPIIIEVRKFPEISGITPTSANPGETVVISGRNFSPVIAENEVRFHSNSLTGAIAQVTASAENSLSVVVPEASRTGLIFITVAGETSQGCMFSVTQPIIKKIEPCKGVSGEALNVTILGENTRFSTGDTTKVDFGHYINVQSFTVDSQTQITANINIPDDAPFGIYSVSVITSGKVLYAEEGFTIDYPSAAPVIEKIEPEPSTPGDLVTITGSHFLKDPFANKVYFNDQDAVIIETNSTQLKVVIPLDFRGGIVTVKSGDLLSNAVNYTVTNLGSRGTITIGQTIQGEIKNQGIDDRYTFTVDQPTQVTISLNRLDNLGGKGSFNPVVMLADSEKKVIAWDDDSGVDTIPGPGKNALIKNMLVPTSGTYTIIVDAGAGINSLEELIVVEQGEEVFDFSKLYGVGPYELALEQE